MRIHQLIIWPFVVLLVVFGLGMAALISNRVSDAVERSAVEKLNALSGFLSHGDAPVNQQAVERMAAAWRIDLVVEHLGAVRASTVNPEIAKQTAESTVSDVYLVRTALLPRDQTAHLLFPRARLVAEAARVRQPLMIGLAIALVVVGVIGAFVARVITRDLRHLAESAARIGDDVHAALDVRTSSVESAELAKRLEVMRADLLVSREALVKGERLAALGQTVSGVAHEVRNPLASMKLAVEMIQSNSSDETLIADSTDRMLHEIDRLDLIVGELLDYGRDAPPNRTALDLRTPTNDVMDLLRRSADHAGVTLNLKAEAAMCNADARHMQQVIFNLLLNGLEASSSGAAIDVHVSSEGQGAVLVVRDHGPGIPEDVRERMFEPFVTTRTGGSGLGLAVVKRIVDAHDGSITVEDASPGTRVTVHVPQ